MADYTKADIRRMRREDRREALRLAYEQLLAVRDAVIWWMGVWAMMTMLDVGLFFAFRAVIGRRGSNKSHDSTRRGGGDSDG